MTIFDDPKVERRIAKRHKSNQLVGDTKNQALQRYLNRAVITFCSIKRYNTNGRKTEYYRLKYRLGRKVKTIHIQGGNCSARLSTYRVQKLQAMIDRGVELNEVLEQLADFNGGTSKNNN